MVDSRYPPAYFKGDGVSGGSWKSGPYKVVLHTTETASLPGYQSGKTAPHLTYVPATRSWTQHTEFDTAARAMVNGPDPVQTNRDSALQVEIVCYSNKAIATQYNRLWVGDLSKEHLSDIRDFLLWARDHFGVKMEWPGKQALSYAEANAPGFRMTVAEWDNFGGVCAHQHVPDGNVHWDTGALDWNTLMEVDEMGMFGWVKEGDDSWEVESWKRILVILDDFDGIPDGSWGLYGSETKELVDKYADPATGTAIGPGEGFRILDTYWGSLSEETANSITTQDAINEVVKRLENG